MDGKFIVRLIIYIILAIIIIIQIKKLIRYFYKYLIPKIFDFFRNIDYKEILLSYISPFIFSISCFYSLIIAIVSIIEIIKKPKIVNINLFFLVFFVISLFYFICTLIAIYINNRVINSCKNNYEYIIILNLKYYLNIKSIGFVFLSNIIIILNIMYDIIYLYNYSVICIFSIISISIIFSMISIYIIFISSQDIFLREKNRYERLRTYLNNRGDWGY